MPRRCATAAVLAAAAATVFAGCGSGGEGGGPAGRPPPATSEAVSPARFAAVAAAPATVMLNVHVPDEGSLPGTDLTVAYDELAARRRELPDRDTTIAIYCRTGRMSTIARRTLSRMGYQRIVELRGGMRAWRSDGRRLLPAAGAAVEIRRPAAGGAVRGDAVAVSVAVRGFEIVRQRPRPPFPPPSAGKGHVHFYLDTERLPRRHGPPTTGAYRSTSTTSYTWTGVAPGRHSLAVQLVGRDHVPLSPPVSDRITVDVE